MFHKFLLHKLGLGLMVAGLLLTPLTSIFAQSETVNTEPTVTVDADTASRLLFLPLVMGGRQAGQQTEALPVANEATTVSTAIATTRPLPTILYLSTSAPVSNLPGLPGKVAANDIVRCVLKDNTCTWALFLIGDDIGLAGTNLLDFEVLANGDVLFVLDRAITLPRIRV